MKVAGALNSAFERSLEMNPLGLVGTFDRSSLTKNTLTFTPIVTGGKTFQITKKLAEDVRINLGSLEGKRIQIADLEAGARIVIYLNKSKEKPIETEEGLATPWGWGPYILAIVVPIKSGPEGQKETKTRLPKRGTFSLADLPNVWLPGEDYRVDPYIRAAMILQSMGKKKAIQRLVQLSKNDDFDENIKIVALCRMLFTEKKDVKFRRPGLGDPGFLGSTKIKDWPLEPIELVNGVPFLIVTGYNLGGIPESGGQYLAYCIAKMEWNKFKFEPKTNREKRAALRKLLAAKKLKGLELEERKFLEAQIK
jgi:hypothetical protein